MHLVPGIAMRALASVLGVGAIKYDAWNWANGFAWSRIYSAALRHLTAWWDGEDKDREDGQSHLWHAFCCVMFLVAHEHYRLGQDDRHPWPCQEPPTS